ncbi:DNA-deoxyinosine glycosylase [Massilia sp. TS11]|uniref:DNA-deoxyinosine glycosylase n=1 Tax=Massilia sp. TS11 TaxID=2908003 RepID=UPI001EDB08ED|nr:DNA-deoxyinosine glycosylase [Massilia sp. TS11]MCG2586274.1 DNA-deoxyinosine glycosylase [Massilia sp. TS11]
MHRKRCFDPVVNAHTRVLILGSLPGDKSLALQQYYGHPQNAFWRLMSDVLALDLQTLPYSARLDALLQHGVGLWDVVADAQRAGSLDSDIRNRADNDLLALLAQHAQIGALAFNGNLARDIGLRCLGGRAKDFSIVALPSSSPAHTMPYAQKLVQWKALQKLLDR